MNVHSKISSSTAAVAAAAAAATGSSSDALAQGRNAPNFVSWEGYYIGASLGAAWLDSDNNGQSARVGSGGYISTSFGGFESSQSSSATNWLAGAQVGRNWQMGRLVYGVEADISWLGHGKASSNGTMNSGYNNAGFGYAYAATTYRESRVKALATFRGRLGYDFNGTMPYLTLGLGLADVHSTWSFTGYSGNPTPAVFTATRNTWTAGLAIGAGVEHQLNSQWSIRGEIMWIGIPDQKISNPVFSNTGAGSHTSFGGVLGFNNDLTIAKISLNYHF